MKVGFFTDTYLPQKNGVVTSICAYQDALTELGAETAVFGPKLKLDEPDPPGIYRYYSVPFPPQPEYTIIFPWAKNHRLSDIQALNLDVIHVETFFSMGLMGLYAARKFNIPAVFTYHTYFDSYLHYLPGPKSVYRKINRRYTRNFCNRFSTVITPSEVIKNALGDYGVSSDIEVVPTGIDLRLIQNRQTIDRNVWGVGVDDWLFCSVGRLAKEKSFDLLINALAMARDQIPAFKWLVIGDGPENKALKRLCQQRGLEDVVKWVGYLPYSQVLDLVHASDLFLFGSSTETQGLVLVEALAMQTPVVAVKALGVSEILGDEQGGLYAPQPTAESLAETICELVNRPDLYAKKRQQTLKRAQFFDIASLSQKLLTLYKTARPPAKADT